MNRYTSAAAESIASSIEEARLKELHKYLSMGGSSWMIGGGAFFLPWGLVLQAMILAAIVFTPYMLWRLYECRRYGWMKGFAVAVGLPALVAVVLSPVGVTGLLLAMLPLLMFYGYTWALRHTVGLWLENLRWTTELDLPRAHSR